VCSPGAYPVPLRVRVVSCLLHFPAHLPCAGLVQVWPHLVKNRVSTFRGLSRLEWSILAVTWLGLDSNVQGGLVMYSLTWLLRGFYTLPSYSYSQRPTVVGGIEIRVVDGNAANTWSLICPGHKSSSRSAQFIRKWGLVTLLRESAPGAAHWWWGGLDGEKFLGRLWMGFLVGTGGERESVRTGSAGSVFAGRHALLNDPIYYVIPYILSGGGFTTSCFRPSRTKTPNPRSSMSWTDTYAVEVSTTDSQWPLAHTEDNVGTCCTLFRHGLLSIMNR
jgi:hypothetical protein